VVRPAGRVGRSRGGPAWPACGRTSIRQHGGVPLNSYTPDQLTAFWTAVTGVCALVTSVVAIATLRALRVDSRDRTRPVVGVELLPIVLSRGTCELVIQNIGASVAKNILVTFDPPIRESMGVTAGYLARRYEQPIPTMGPGRRLTNVYGHRRGDGTAAFDEDVPLDIAVTVDYEDSHGRQYRDSYALTSQTLMNETTTSPSNTDEKGIQRRLVQALEAIARGVANR